MNRWGLVSCLVVIGLLVAGMGAGPAGAAPTQAEVEFTGTVTAVNAAARTLQVEVLVAEGQSAVYTVHVPAGLDLAGIAAGDTVEVEGTLAGEGVVNATRLRLEEKAASVTPPAAPTVTAAATATPVVTPTISPTAAAAATATPGLAPTLQPTATLVITPTAIVVPGATVTSTVAAGKTGRYCRDRSMVHPVAKGIADTYGVSYDEVIDWFCKGQKSLGQIILALQTAALTGEAPEDLLVRRSAGEGWGEIWQDLGLIGKGKGPVPPSPEPTLSGSKTPEPRTPTALPKGNKPTDTRRAQDGKPTQPAVRDHGTGKKATVVPKATVRPGSKPIQAGKPGTIVRSTKVVRPTEAATGVKGTGRSVGAADKSTSRPANVGAKKDPGKPADAGANRGGGKP